MYDYYPIHNHIIINQVILFLLNMKTRTRLLSVVLFALAVFLPANANNQLTLFDGDDSSNTAPINLVYFDEIGARTQVIYPASSLAVMTGEVINSMKFYTSDPITEGGGMLQISIGETDQMHFAGSTYVEGLTQVASYSMTSGVTEIEIVFDEPYTYMGGNLVFESLVTETTNESFVTFWGTKERVEPPADQGSDILADLRQLVTNWPWVVLLVVGLLFNVYNAVRQGITVIYFTHYMHREVLCSAFLTAIMVASIGGALATGPLARRFGKRVLFVASLLLAGAVNSLFAFCGPGDVAAVFAIGIVGEALSAVFPTLFFTMLGDAADYSEYVNGRRATGLVYSAGSFATKFGGGVAGFIIGIVLARYGYDGKDAEAIAGALPGIRLLMGLIPSAIAAGTAFLMVLYPLSDRRLSEITEELSRRRG